MDLIVQGIGKAFSLIFSLDREVMQIALLTLQISGSATLISLLLGLCTGIAVSFYEFPGKRLAISLINTGMGIPPVVAGLIVVVMLWRSGPFGFLGILYSPMAMVIAQAVIASPIIAGITLAAMQSLPEKLKLQILALGATRRQLLWMLIKESRLPILAGIMAGFGAVISEVGASIMVGGNIRGQTRVLTTATVMETSRGNFDIAIALGVILLALTFAVNYLLTVAQQRGKKV